MKCSVVLLLSVLGAASFPALNEPLLNAEYRRFEGDILEDLNTTRAKRGAPDVSNANKKWPLNQVISYKLESAYDATFAQAIRDAFKFWTDNTCLTYQENGPTTPLIRVLKANTCSSPVGRQDGAQSQPLNLDKGCEQVGTIVHEIGHSIGLGHTHMRADRDSYITINTKNIDPRAIANFDKWSPERNNNFGVDYDYSSVMQYGADGFAIDRSIPVITTKDPNAQGELGQRERAAFSDVKMVNLFYNCAQKCPSASVNCQNGGFINSKTCSSCICPPMFTGSDCSQRQPAKGKYASASCGADLTATAAWQNVQSTFGEYGQQYKDGTTECYWNVKAPVGRKIEIRVNSVSMWCETYCSWNKIEFYMRGFGYGGYKFCCPEKLNGKVFQSKDNGVSILMSSSYSNSSMHVDYRMI